MHTSRRRLLGLLSAGAAAGLIERPARAQQTIRIGFQKYGLLVILKARATLEQALRSRGWSVSWAEFPGGIQLVEALQAGRLDLGVVGEAPPIFALAARAPVVYLGAEPAAPAAEALVVPENGPLKIVKDLRGKRVVVNKGSNAHYLLIRALEEAKVPYGEVRVSFVPPAGARAALESGQVDAWSIWDPFLASVQKNAGACVLRDGRGLVDNIGYYLGLRDFARAQPAIVEVVLEQIRQTGAWANQHPTEVVDLLAPALGIDKPSLALAVGRAPFGVQPVGRELLASQQRIADVFFQLRIIPRPIKVDEGRAEG